MVLKKIIGGLLLSASVAHASVEELTTFKAITERLEAGKDIKAIIHDDLCVMDDNNPHKIPASTMIIKPTAVLFTGQVLGFDSSKFASNTLPFAAQGLLQRATFALYESGAAEIVIAFFDAETNKKIPQWADVKIHCKLNEGARIYTA